MKLIFGEVVGSVRTRVVYDLFEEVVVKWGRWGNRVHLWIEDKLVRA